MLRSNGALYKGEIIVIFENKIVGIKMRIMRCGSLMVYSRRYGMILLLGILMCFSCCVNDTAERRDISETIGSRSFLFPSSLADFFSYSCTGIDSIVYALRNIDKEKNFIDGFVKKYGIPLWNSPVY